MHLWKFKRLTRRLSLGEGSKDSIRSCIMLHQIIKLKVQGITKVGQNMPKKWRANIIQKGTISNSCSSKSCICIPRHYSVIHIISIDDIRTLWCCILWCNIHTRLWPGFWVPTYGARVARAHTCVVHLAQLNLNGKAAEAGKKWCRITSAAVREESRVSEFHFESIQLRVWEVCVVASSWVLGGSHATAAVKAILP